MADRTLRSRILIFPEATPWWRIYLALFAPVAVLLGLSFVGGGVGRAAMTIGSVYAPVAIIVTVFVMAYDKGHKSVPEPPSSVETKEQPPGGPGW